MEQFKSPLADALVAALGAPSTVSTDSDDLPKDGKVEVFTKLSFQTTTEALKASVASSFSNRALLIWMHHFSEM